MTRDLSCKRHAHRKTCPRDLRPADVSGCGQARRVLAFGLWLVIHGLASPVLGQTPTATLVAPPHGSQFAVDEPIDLVAVADTQGGAPIAAIDFLLYGSKIGSVTADEPYQLTLAGLPEGLHVLRARVRNEDGVSSLSEPVTVRVGEPAAAALLVVRRIPMQKDERTVAAHLERMGYDVEPVTTRAFDDEDSDSDSDSDGDSEDSDSDSDSEDSDSEDSDSEDSDSEDSDSDGDSEDSDSGSIVDGKSVIVAASRFNPTPAMSDKLREVEIPVVTWNKRLYQLLGMADATGMVNGRTSLEIVDPSSPLAAGLSGEVVVTSRPGRLSWGVPAAGAAVAALPEDSQKATILAYEAGEAMLGRTAPARRVGLFLARRTASHLTAEGWLLFEAAVAWAAGFEPLPGPFVDIASPAEGATFAAGDDVAVVVDAGPVAAVEQLDLLLNGGLVATSSSAPAEWVIPSLPAGLYSLRARALIGGEELFSHPVRIVVGAPSNTCLVVIGGAPSVDDLALRDRLDALGFVPALVNATDLTGAEASAAALLVIAPSVQEGQLAVDLRHVETPILNLEGVLYSDLGMTAAEGFGVSEPVTSMEMDISLGFLGGSPLSAGLVGTVEVFQTPQALRWGLAGANAIGVAGTPASGVRRTLFAFERGALMPGGVAPARRAGFFVVDGPLDLTAAGWALFDAAAAWVAGFGIENRPPTVALTSPVQGAALPDGQAIELAAQAADADGSVASVVFYANGRAIGSVSAPPFELAWAGAATGLYQLVAQAVDEEGAAAMAAPVHVVVGSPAVDALILVGNPQSPSPDDAAIAARLAALGLEVEMASASEVSAASAAGRALVVVSSSVDASALDPAFASLAVPLVSWNADLYPVLGWTEAESASDSGFASQQLELVKVEGGSMLSLGLDDRIAFTSLPAAYAWGRPAQAATVGARLANGDPALFGYDSGAEMFAGVAPARRLALPLGDETVTGLTAIGGSVVDVALAWAMAHLPPMVDDDPPTLTIVTPQPAVLVDPSLADLVTPGIAIAYGDAGVGIDLDTVQVSFRNLRSEAPFEMADLCSIGVAGATCPMPLVAVGDFEIVAEVADRAGNFQQARVQFSVESSFDLEPPVMTVTSPVEGAFLSDPAVTVQGTVSDDDQLASLRVQSMLVTQQAGPFSHSLTLDSEGEHEITLVAQDFMGRATVIDRTVTLDSTAPELVIEDPLEGALVSDATIRLRGLVRDDHLDSVTVNGVPLVLDEEGHFDQSESLAPGQNNLELVARDMAGNETSAAISVFRSTPVEVEITSPTDGSLSTAQAVTVTGTVGAGVSSVQVGGVLAEVSGGSFAVQNYHLHEGTNTITAVATDAVGVSTTSTVRVFRDSQAPVLTLLSPSQGETIAASAVTVTGVVRDISNAPVPAPAVSVAGQPAEVTGGTFRAVVPLAAGSNSIAVAATDAAGNTTTLPLTVERESLEGLPALHLVSGDGQVAGVREQLAAPLIVELIEADGTPAAARRVIFEVVGSDGSLAGAGSGSPRSRVVETDAQGQAAVVWSLGSRAGFHDRVLATAVGFAGAATFGARAEVGQPAELYIDSGNYQTGAVSEVLPLPLRVAVTDGFQNPVPGADVRFEVSDGGGRVAGAESVTVTTGADGRVGVRLALGPDELREGNAVRAELVGGSASPAIFLATGLVPGLELATAVRGLVLDNADQPVPGVTLSIDGSPQTAVTDGEGQFEISPAPVGHVHLVADGSTATRPGDWPTLAFEMVTVSGRINAMDRPIYILPVRTSDGLAVGPETGGTLTLPDVPGLELAIEPGSATFSDGSQSGVVSVTLVHADKVPMAPNYGQQPRLVLTVQPPSVTFDPPAKLTFPNVNGLPPGAVGDIFSFRHDLGEFVSIGPGTVSEDGSVLVTGDGLGLRAGGWHYDPPPPEPRAKTDGCGGCPECKECTRGGCQYTGEQDGKTCTPDDFCVVDPTCGPKGCTGDPFQSHVESRIDVKTDVLKKIDEAIEAITEATNTISPCEAEKGNLSISGRGEFVKHCCEELDEFQRTARGSGNASRTLGFKSCMMPPPLSFPLGALFRVGVYWSATLQPRLQVRFDVTPCGAPPQCSVPLTGSISVKGALEGGLLLEAGGGDIISAQAALRGETTGKVTINCNSGKGEVVAGPLSGVVRATFGGGPQLVRFWEVPNSRVVLIGGGG